MASPGAPNPQSLGIAGPDESLPVAALLAACGGFLDAFTYIGHGHVFANAMTGNVVLLGVNAAAGNLPQTLSHLYPILAFLLGVAVAQVFRLAGCRPWIPHPTIASLGVEILFCLVGGFFPKGFAGTPLVLGISFLAALQSSTFRKAGRWNYNSTMTTGNLRILGEAIFAFGNREAEAAEKAGTFAVICLAFLAGAVIGALSTSGLDNRALWIVDALLLIVWLRLFIRLRATPQNPGGRVP